MVYIFKAHLNSLSKTGVNRFKQQLFLVLLFYSLHDLRFTMVSVKKQYILSIHVRDDIYVNSSTLGESLHNFEGIEVKNSCRKHNKRFFKSD